MTSDGSGLRPAAGQVAAPKNLTLVTQMRSGTHFICAALRIALGATLYRPIDNKQYLPMEDDYIARGLREEVPLPPAAADRHIYFSHYYHPHHDALEPIPRIVLIGFPLDTYYSEGIIYSDTVSLNDPAPSVSRRHAPGYVYRYDTPEWRFLEPRTVKNAVWLNQLGESEDELLIRYEDFFLDFDATAARIERFVGGFLAPMPRPILNAKRTYWTERYAEAFDPAALDVLCSLFAKSIRRFYPERWPSVQAAWTAVR